MHFPPINSQAPAFSLLNQHGEAVSLADFKGRNHVVLYFYPRASTPGCTVQACGMRDYASQLAALDAVTLAVSPDSVKKLKNFADKQQLAFDLLSDEDHKLAEQYGVWGLKKFMGRESMGILRTTFIIDKSGKLRYIIDKVKTKSHNEDVVKLLQQL